MTPQSEWYDTTPMPSMLRAMQAQKWTAAGAISELVDNSFGPGRGNAHRVQITHDTKARTITVLDNGQGMTAIGRLFQLGSSPVRAPGDIGNYGFGGSFGVLWLAKRVEIWTLVSGKVQHDAINWPDAFVSISFPKVSNRWEPATVANTPSDLLDEWHGTLIRLQLGPERTLLASNVQRDLAATYAPAARLGRELIWTTIGKNGETRNLGDAVIAFPDPAKTISFNLVVTHGDVSLPVTGMVGIVDGLAFERSTIAIGFGPRVILRTKDCYQSPDRTKRYSGSGVTGWLDLGEGWQPYLTTTKDGVNDQPVWDVLMKFVFEKIEPILQMVETSRLELVLDGIALNLERQLGGLSKVDVASRDRRVPGRELGGSRQGTDGTGEGRHTHEPDAVDGKDTKAEGVTRILLVPQDEEQMEEQLIAAEEVGGGIQASINIDHDVIKEAIKARPINQMLLNVGVTRELAEVIAGSETLRSRLFSGHRLKELEQHEGPKVSRLIHRWLMDNVKEPA